MRAMNSAMCQELAPTVSAKLALVCPESRNRPALGGGHLCPLRWAALTSAVPAPATATRTHSSMNLLSSSVNGEGIVSNLAQQRT